MNEASAASEAMNDSIELERAKARIAKINEFDAKLRAILGGLAAQPASVPIHDRSRKRRFAQ